mgnify:CR=1 FL=1
MLERYPDKMGRAPRLIDFLDLQSRGVKIRLFGVTDNGELVAHATIDFDVDGVCGVHPFTLEKHRGKGYGKSAMSIATQAVLDMGKIPYYDANRDNIAAVRLAESLGYFVYQEITWGKGAR